MAPSGINSLWTISSESKKVMSMVLTFDFCRRTFLDGESSGLFQTALCCFVSGSYWKHRVSSPATIVFKKFESLSAVKMTPWTFQTRACFWSSLKPCGTNRAQTFHSFKSSFNMRWSCDLLIPVTSSMSLTDIQRPLLISSRIFSTDSSIRLDAGRPLRSSSSSDSLPSLNFLNYS